PGCWARNHDNVSGPASGEPTTNRLGHWVPGIGARGAELRPGEEHELIEVGRVRVTRREFVWQVRELVPRDVEVSHRPWPILSEYRSVVSLLGEPLEGVRQRAIAVPL